MQLMEMPVLRWNSQQATADECNITNHLDLKSIRFDALDELTAEQYEYLVSSPEENFTKSSNCYTSFLAMDRENKINHEMTIIDISDHSFEPPPTKQIKTNTWKYSDVLLAKPSSSPSSSSHLISFANFSSQPTDSRTSPVDLVSPVLVPKAKDELLTFEVLSQTYNLDDNKNIIYSSTGGQGTKRSNSSTILSTTPSHAQDHVIAERKRRERLTERFIALSAVVPGLKKLDKASVLGDAIKYLKHLQERVKLLEEQVKKKKREESFVSLNSCQHPAYDGDSSSSDHVNSSGCLNKGAVPEIDATVSEKNVLIRIHCEKQKGLVPKMLSEIEKLHLIVINSNVLPFGDYALVVAVVAQMDDEFCLTVKELVRNLRSALH